MSENLLYYFAYGSNLHPVRLREPERVPSAQLVGVIRLNQRRLAFHKKSRDRSSKCNLVHTGEETDVVYGAIYQMDSVDKNALDDSEGKGHGYIDQQIILQHQGQKYNCFTYFAQQSHIVENLKPYHWYKQLVVLGAKYLHFPDSYIFSIEAIESMEDPNEKNRKENESLIEKIINYGKDIGGESHERFR